MFYFAQGDLQSAFGLFDVGNIEFIHFIPLTDGEGRLMLDYNRMPTDTILLGNPVVCVNVNANGELAWRFIKHMIYAQDGNNHLATPILQSRFMEHTESSLRNAQAEMRSQGFLPSVTNAVADELQIQNALSRLEILNQMAATTRIPPRHEIQMSFQNRSSDFAFRGTLSAESYARELENLMNNWLASVWSWED